MNIEQRQELIEKISKEIHSDKSPVGIDAKKTHVLILLQIAELKEEIKELKVLMESK
jgi:archaellum component FlaC